MSDLYPRITNRISVLFAIIFVCGLYLSKSSFVPLIDIPVQMTGSEILMAWMFIYGMGIYIISRIMFKTFEKVKDNTTRDFFDENMEIMGGSMAVFLFLNMIILALLLLMKSLTIGYYMHCLYYSIPMILLVIMIFLMKDEYVFDELFPGAFYLSLFYGVVVWFTLGFTIALITVLTINILFNLLRYVAMFLMSDPVVATVKYLWMVLSNMIIYPLKGFFQLVVWILTVGPEPKKNV